MRRLPTKSIAVAITLTVSSIIAVWSATTVPSQHVLDTLQPGMTKDQVISMIGSPTKETDDGTFWVYSSPFRMSYAKLDFDSDGRLKSVDLDE